MPWRAFVLSLLCIPITGLGATSTRRNALAGIRCFSTLSRWRACGRSLRSQCPGGHLLFFYRFVRIASTKSKSIWSQCPGGHSFFFYNLVFEGVPVMYLWSQCPGGHSFFFYMEYTRWEILFVGTGIVSMPWRAFVVFLPSHGSLHKHLNRSKSQCPVGHFCFYHHTEGKVVGCFAPVGRGGLNALSGISVFTTCLSRAQWMVCQKRSQCPVGHFCFYHQNAGGQWIKSGMSGLNALSGISVFTTRRLTISLPD